MRESENKKRTYIIIGLCAVVMIMAVGFAVFSQQLQINSTSEVTSTWDIEITDIEAANPNGGDAYDITPPSYTPTTATFSAGLVSPDDGRLYQAEVSNLGSLTGEVSVASLSCGNNDAIGCEVYEFDGRAIDENGDIVNEMEHGIDVEDGVNNLEGLEFKLEPGEKHYIIVYVFYDSSVVTQPTNLSTDITLTLNYVQASSSRSPVIDNSNYIYRCNSDYWSGNQDISGMTEGTDYVTSPEDVTNMGGAASTYGDKFYLKYKVEEDVVAESYVCFVTDTEHCLRGGVDECDWDNSANNGNGACTSSIVPTVYNANVGILNSQQSWFTNQNPAGSCSLNSNGFTSSCSGGGLTVISYSSGFVSVASNTSPWYCLVNEYGESMCSND